MNPEAQSVSAVHFPLIAALASLRSRLLLDCCRTTVVVSIRSDVVDKEPMDEEVLLLLLLLPLLLLLLRKKDTTKTTISTASTTIAATIPINAVVERAIVGRGKRDDFFGIGSIKRGPPFDCAPEVQRECFTMYSC